MVEADKYFPRIERFVLPQALLDQSLQRLRAEGMYQVESILFWAGTSDAGIATVTHILVPKGKGVFQHPLQIRVSEEIMAALFDILAPPDLILLGQVHTHLGEAFHSHADDRYSPDTPGFLSLVVPYGGRDGVEAWMQWAFYECIGSGRFRPLDAGEITRRFVIDKKGKISIHEIRSTS
jgi:hypothetical protein